MVQGTYGRASNAAAFAAMKLSKLSRCRCSLAVGEGRACSKARTSLRAHTEEGEREHR